MNKKIWKFMVMGRGKVNITMPEDAEVLFIHEQNGFICIWALVSPDKLPESRDFMIIGTGELNSSPNQHYLGSVHLACGDVYHVFGRRK